MYFVDEDVQYAKEFREYTHGDLRLNLDLIAERAVCPNLNSKHVPRFLGFMQHSLDSGPTSRGSTPLST